MYYVIKIITSAVLIFLISEIAKKSSFWGAIIASLPIVSIIAFVFLYQESKEVQKISNLSSNIFWMVLPSLSLFITLPYFLKKGLNFYVSLGLGSLITVLLYLGLIQLLQHFQLLKY